MSGIFYDRYRAVSYVYIEAEKCHKPKGGFTMTKKHFLNIALFIVMMLGMMGCNAGYSGSQNGSGQSAVTNDSGDNPTVTDPLKATTLQSVVNNAKAGEVIDLSEYKEITDYTATIRKALTLQNGSLKGATLSVANDEVTLVGLTDLSIKTNSSVSLDGCAIETLEYTDIPDGDEGRGGRGDSKFTTTTIMFQNNASGTKITSLQLNLTDTSVSDVIDLSYYPSITDYDAVLDKTIKLNCKTSEETTLLPVVISDGSKAVNITKSGYGNNNFSNGSTKITSFEGAISLPLPGTTTTVRKPGTITVNGTGEVVVTDLDDKDNNKLLKITPYSGFNSIITEGQQPDFSKLIMLDTFTANNVKVFKAGGLTFEKTDTVSKLEKDFTVTINGTEYFKNGKVMSKTPLAVGKYPAKITCDYENCDDGYEFDFTFTVMEKKVDAELILESISIVPNNSMKTVYKVGDRLDLNGLIVVGNYTYGDVSYQNVLTNYTLTPDNGTILSSRDISVTVYALGKTTTVPIEVKPAYTFTFVIAKDYTVDYQVTSGETQEALKNFNVEGASFGGWFTDSSYKTEFDFDTPITQGTTVYAKWSNPIVYNNVCDAANPNPTSYTDSEDITLEDLTRVGYTFGGWHDASADGTVVTGWSAGDKAGLVELWASWTPIAYTIVLDANNGTGEPISLSAVYDESATLPTAEKFTAPTGLVFGSWNTKADGTGSSYSAGQEVINFADTNGTIVTLYAQWIDKAAFKITYQNTMNADNPNPASFLESQDVTIAPLTKSGYTFGGWYDASADDTIVTGWSAGAKTADVTLYARWTENVHSITYQNTKNVTNPNAATFRELDNVTLTNLGNTTGYTFDGWYDAADGGNKVSGWEALAQTADVTVYAHWTAIGYTIKFNANGGTGSMSNLAMTYDTAKNLTANAFTKTGYTFQGWGESANATTAKYTNKQSVNNLTSTAGATVTLYAVWKANTYTIKFNANGGSGSMSNLVMTYGVAKALTPNSFTKSGYAFLGWATSSSATSAAYNDKQTVNNLSSAAGTTVTLYAVWKVGGYTITLDWQNNSQSSTILAECGEEPVYPIITKSGYKFGGFWTQPNGQGTKYCDWFGNATKVWDIQSNATLYAHWYAVQPGYIVTGDAVLSPSQWEAMESKPTPIGIVVTWSGTSGTMAEPNVIWGEKSWCYETAEGYNKYIATSETDGSINWGLICNAVSDENRGLYPAFHYCNSKTAGGFTWYLPARNELVVADSSNEVGSTISKIKEVCEQRGLNPQKVYNIAWSSTMDPNIPTQAFVGTQSVSYDKTRTSGVGPITVIAFAKL